jgi:hypothetical protein
MYFKKDIASMWEISSSLYPYHLRNLNTGEDNIGLATQPFLQARARRSWTDSPMILETTIG